MKKYGSLCVPIDRTNPTRLILISEYKRWVFNHLLKADDIALRPIVIDLFEEANELIEKLKMYFLGQEEQFLR